MPNGCVSSVRPTPPPHSAALPALNPLHAAFGFSGAEPTGTTGLQQLFAAVAKFPSLVRLHGPKIADRDIYGVLIGCGSSKEGRTVSSVRQAPPFQWTVRALDADPIDALPWTPSCALTVACAGGTRPKGSILLHLIELDPDDWRSRVELASEYAFADKYKEALHQVEMAEERAAYKPDFTLADYCSVCPCIIAFRLRSLAERVAQPCVDPQH